VAEAPERTAEKGKPPSRTRVVFAFGGSLGVFGALLFASAGRLAWVAGWLYLGIVMTNVIINYA